MEQAKDSVKGMADSAASTLQPEVRVLLVVTHVLLTLCQSQKSMTQQAGDKISGNSNKNSESLLDSAKNGEQIHSPSSLVAYHTAAVGLGDK